MFGYWERLIGDVGRFAQPRLDLITGAVEAASPDLDERVHIAPPPWAIISPIPASITEPLAK